MSARHTKARRRESFRREHLWLAKLARVQQSGEAFRASLNADSDDAGHAHARRYERTRLRATAPHDYDPEQVDAAGAMRCEACGREGGDALHGFAS